jgi:glycosyltransferase involved in cell wall biosynthesis
MNADVSIVITNYNYSKYIQRCLRSCINQKYVNHDVIVVDDCSTDNSIEKLSPFLEDIKLYKTDQNSGVAAAANLGVEKSKSQFFIRVDADDFITSNMCYIMKEYLEANNDCFCVSCDYYMVNNGEEVVERKYAEVDDISCGIMYRRDLFLDLGGYNPDMRHKEERELRKRLGLEYKIDHLKIPFYRYRMHDSNKTKSKEYEQTKV